MVVNTPRLEKSVEPTCAGHAGRVHVHLSKPLDRSIDSLDAIELTRLSPCDGNAELAGYL